MKHLTITITLLTLLILGGCATPYQPEGAMGGFYETRIDENVYRVSFRGNAYTSLDKATYFTMLRSAELTLEKGYNHFLVIDEEQYFKEVTSKMPDRTSYSTQVRKSPDRIRLKVTVKNYPGQEITTYKPRSSNTIMMFKYPPADEYFDARYVKRTIENEYNLQKGPIPIAQISTRSASTNIKRDELDVPGPDLDLITSQIEESIKDRDTREGMQHLTELGLHCGSVYLHGTIILRMTGVDEEEVAPIVERLEDAYSMAMTTLSLEDAIEEIKLRSHDIRDWYFAHEDAGRFDRYPRDTPHTP